MKSKVSKQATCINQNRNKRALQPYQTKKHLHFMFCYLFSLYFIDDVICFVRFSHFNGFSLHFLLCCISLALIFIQIQITKSFTEWTTARAHSHKHQPIWKWFVSIFKMQIDWRDQMLKPFTLQRFVSLFVFFFHTIGLRSALIIYIISHMIAWTDC